MPTIFASMGEAAASATAAARTAGIINNQYLAGTQAYTAVVVAEQTALADAESELTGPAKRGNSSPASRWSRPSAAGGTPRGCRHPKIESDQPLNFSPIPAPDPNPVK